MAFGVYIQIPDVKHYVVFVNCKRENSRYITLNYTLHALCVYDSRSLNSKIRQKSLINQFMCAFYCFGKKTGFLPYMYGVNV